MALPRSTLSICAHVAGRTSTMSIDPLLRPHGNGELHVFDQLLHGAQLLDVFVRHVDREAVLDCQDQRHGIERACAEVVYQPRLARDMLRLLAQDDGDQRDQLTCDVAHGVSAFTPIWRVSELAARWRRSVSLCAAG